jgi:hypothetical protein
MCLLKMAGRGVLAVLWIALTANVAVPQTTSGNAPEDTLLAGCKYLHTLPYEVYRAPLFLDTKDGPRLAVWVHEGDPSRDGLPDIFGAKDDKKKVDPAKIKQTGFDLFLWDVSAGKELYRLTKKDSAPPLPAQPRFGSLFFQGDAPFGMLNYTPNGKKLLCVVVEIEQQAFVARIKLYDPETRKWQTLPTADKGSGIVAPQIIFAPDGAMVILHEAQCTIQEIGKAKPRQVFKLERAGKALFAGGPLVNLEDTGFDDAVLSPDGKSLAIAADNAVHVYDIASGKRTFQAPGLLAGDTRRYSFFRAALAFAPSGEESRLMAVESVPDRDKGKFVAVARVFDLKTKKETVRTTLLEGGEAKQGATKSPAWGQAYPYFNAKGEPRVLFESKLFDVAADKVLQESSQGYGYILSRDGKYVVRLTGVTSDKNKLGMEVWSMDMDK